MSSFLLSYEYSLLERKVVVFLFVTTSICLRATGRVVELSFQGTANMIAYIGGDVKQNYGTFNLLVHHLGIIKKYEIQAF